MVNPLRVMGISRIFMETQGAVPAPAGDGFWKHNKNKLLAILPGKA